MEHIRQEDSEEESLPKRPRLEETHTTEIPESMDNSGAIAVKIASLYAERLMSDLILEVGGRELPAHRLILCASSDVFQVMLMGKSWTESQEKKIVLKETQACAQVFEVFLKYLYTGKIKISYGNVMPVLQLADKYNVKDLLKLGLDFMARNVSLAIRKHQIVSWYQFANNANYRQMSRLCFDYIKWNFCIVSVTIDWANLEADSLIKLLNCSDLVIQDEICVLKAVQRWLTAQKSRMEEEGMEGIEEHMENLVVSTVSCIRFPMMSPSDLADLLLWPLTKTYMEFMIDRMSMAMAYHRNMPDAVTEILKKYPNGDRLLTPRLYTVDKFCASLSVDYFPQLPVYHSRSLLYSSQESTADHSGDGQSEWMVDLYPKGVWFQKCFKIFPAGEMQEVPEKVLRTVRVSISTKDEAERRVKIGIIVLGEQEGFSHVRHVRTSNYIFGPNDQIVNFDDLLSFDELNDLKRRSCFLIGPNRDTLKIEVTITPLNRMSSLAIP